MDEGYIHGKGSNTTTEMQPAYSATPANWTDTEGDKKKMPTHLRGLIFWRLNLTILFNNLVIFSYNFSFNVMFISKFNIMVLDIANI